MDKVVLLAELRALADKVPDFSSYSPSSRPHLEWIGKANALLQRWDRIEVVSFTTAADFLPLDVTRDMNVAMMLGVLHRAIADLALQVPALPPQAFGPGAVYDFHKSLQDLLASATKSLFIVDPYLDDQVFDAYLSTVSQEVHVRLLARDYAASLRTSVQKFIAQRKVKVELDLRRRSTTVLYLLTTGLAGCLVSQLRTQRSRNQHILRRSQTMLRSSRRQTMSKSGLLRFQYE
jgi:hypothetical protein